MRVSQRSSFVSQSTKRANAARYGKPVLCAAVTLCLQLGALAAPDAAQFDAPSLVACTSVSRVSSSNSPLSDHDEMLVEATFDVSTLLSPGQERSVRQILCVIESPTAMLSVVDYSPSTELTSRYATNIKRNRKRDEQQSAGVNASIIPTEAASLQANASHGGSESESIGFETLPPKDLLAASGTMSRGRAVYFKFNATPQTTLEGRRELRVAYRVPLNWRCSYVYLRCVAYKSNSGDRQGDLQRAGSGDYLVALHREGDAEARQQARQMVDAELRLRRAAPRAKVQAPKKDTFATRLTAVFHSKPDRSRSLPTQWLNQVLTSSAERREFEFSSNLPPSVQDALSEFTQARFNLNRLNEVRSDVDPLVVNDQVSRPVQETHWRPRATASTN